MGAKSGPGRKVMGVRLGAIVGATATGGGVAPLEASRGGTPLVVSLLQPVISATEAQVAQRERPPRPRAEPKRRLIEKSPLTHTTANVLGSVQRGSTELAQVLCICTISRGMPAVSSTAS